MAEKRYFWLKLYDDFFTSKRIKKLRSIAGGDTYTIIYLKMQLKALKTDGYLYFDGVMSDFAEELALDLDESAEDVKITINYLMSVNLLETNDGEEYKLPFLDNCIGSENASAQRVREHRAKQKEATIKVEAKTNAERQNAYRAKKLCEENGHIPYIEDYVNKKRYGGNYYICFKRDKCECVICGGNDELCMHHIDGYYENKPQNNYQNKMITLCRKCHSNIHAGEPIPTKILESIGYYDISNESNEICNKDVTEVKRVGNAEKEIEIDIEKDKKEIKEKRFTPPTLEEVKAYCKERNNTVDPETFIDFYTAKGWCVGKNKMKDWRACVRTWERNRNEKKTQNAFNDFKQTDYDWDEINSQIGYNAPQGP